ncbi:hypothetical protein LWM68_24985 [Niabella sp. W65]|nr:hypothetical protein [Niabella sp. W65]MCH7365732.1 hypothetical protein [Niabella sp. W65]
MYTPNFQLAEVKVDGATYKCILKDLQFDKVTDALIHVDLLELVEDKKLSLLYLLNTLVHQKV